MAVSVGVALGAQMQAFPPIRAVDGPAEAFLKNS